MGIHTAVLSGLSESIGLPPGLNNLPPFPAVALRALNILSGTDTSLRELCDVVRPDPVFSAEVLRIANSPLVAFPKQVTNVLQASMLLGFRRLRQVVITVGLRSYLNQALTPLLQSCWRHSVACAMCAERAARWNSIDREFAYTAGILHDIGRVALATVGPESYAHLIKSGDAQGRIGLSHERELFGIDHCQAGSMLVTAWGLPEDFIPITAHHHDPLTHAEDATEVVRLSCMLADALGFAATAQNGSRSYEEVLEDLPEEVRTHFPGVDDLSAEITREIGVIEGAEKKAD